MNPGKFWTKWWIVGILMAMALGAVAACGSETIVEVTREVEVEREVEREVTRIVEGETMTELVEVTRIVEGETMTELVEVTRIVEGETMIVEQTVVVEATPTPAPKVGRQETDSVVLVFDGEPLSMFFPDQLTAISDTPVRDNLIDPIVWQSAAPGDDYKLVPTTLTTGWESVDADTWRFSLREGVKFHNGEEWNAQAAIPSFTFQGQDPTADSYGYTGAFTPEVVSDYVLDIHCAEACAIFPRTAIFLSAAPPVFFETASPEEQQRINYGAGPYQFKDWDSTQLTFEAYEDYVEVEREDGSIHPEFQKAIIPEIRWQWRAERLTQAAMVAAGEADMAWDVGLDAASVAPASKSGGALETLSMKVMSLGCNWHPELCKKEVRLAIAHSIDCETIRDTIYNGLTTCRGTNEWLGVTGVTPEADAPHEYNPDKAKELLVQAGYDKNNMITINSRAFRVTKGNEIYEAISLYMRNVGITNQMVIQDPSIWRPRSACGAGEALRSYLVDVEGMDRENLDLEAATPEQIQAALDRGPAGVDCSPGDLVTSTLSDELLDMQRTLLRNMSCWSSGSYYCNPDQIDAINEARGTPEGDLRFQRMQVFHDQLKNDALVIGVFDLGVTYAVNPRLVWEPRIDRRVRVNNMSFID